MYKESRNLCLKKDMQNFVYICRCFFCCWNSNPEFKICTFLPHPIPVLSSRPTVFLPLPHCQSLSVCQLVSRTSIGDLSHVSRLRRQHFAIDKYKHEMHFQINQPQLDPNLTLPTCSGEALQLSVACCNTFCGSSKSPNSMAIYQKIICNILLAMLDVA